MAQRKQSKKQSQKPLSVILFIGVIVLVCLAYEPVAKALRKGCETAVTTFQEELNQSKSNTAQQETKAAKSNKAQQSAKKQKETKQKRLSDMPAESSGMELPASLKGKRSEYILKRKGYTASFNREWNLPNWVAWELNKDKLVEREGRSDKFLPDPDLSEAEAVTTDDYKRSGWDRGHMCPAGDNRWHWKAMQESFYMTNICPQDHNLNRGDWKELEEKCRRWAEKEGSIYIVCGPILYNRKHQVIGKEHRIIVPEAFFKVVLSLNGKQPKAAGFIFKNSSGNRKLESYLNTVDEVERITGIDFFHRLPDDIEEAVESKLGDFDL